MNEPEQIPPQSDEITLPPQRLSVTRILVIGAICGITVFAGGYLFLQEMATRQNKPILGIRPRKAAVITVIVTPTPEVTETSTIPADWARYVAPDNIYAFSYPPQGVSAQYTEATNTGVQVTLADKQPVASSSATAGQRIIDGIIFKVLFLKGQTNLETIVNSQRSKDVASSSSDKPRLNQNKQIILDGKYGFSYTLETSYNGYAKTVFLPLSTGILFIRATYNPATGKTTDYVSTIDQILSTFTFQ